MVRVVGYGMGRVVWYCKYGIVLRGRYDVMLYVWFARCGMVGMVWYGMVRMML